MPEIKVQSALFLGQPLGRQLTRMRTKIVCRVSFFLHSCIPPVFLFIKITPGS